jgi:hypothetical protein
MSPEDFWNNEDKIKEYEETKRKKLLNREEFENALSISIRRIPYVQKKLEWDREYQHFNVWDYLDILKKLIKDENYIESVELAKALHNFTMERRVFGEIISIPNKKCVRSYLKFYVEFYLKNFEIDLMDLRHVIGIPQTSVKIMPSPEFGFLRGKKFEITDNSENEDVKFIKTMCDLIISNLPSNASAEFKKKGELYIKELISMYIILNEYNKAKEITNIYIYDILYKLDFYTCLTNTYIEHKKYKEAIETAKWILNNWVLKKESLKTIKKAKLSCIEILKMDKSFKDAENEYREMGELRLAIEMYEKEGMYEDAARISSEMDNPEDGHHPVEDGDTANMSNKCPNPECGKKVEPGWKICPFCEIRLKNVCEKCGKELKQEWKVCPWC